MACSEAGTGTDYICDHLYASLLFSLPWRCRYRCLLSISQKGCTSSHTELQDFHYEKKIHNTKDLATEERQTLLRFATTTKIINWQLRKELLSKLVVCMGMAH